MAIIDAVAAIVLVVAAGLLVRAPLARVPENTLKFGVSVLLTSFGTFWAVEGAGANWPGSDLALLAVIAFVLIGALGAAAVLRRARERHLLASVPSKAVMTARTLSSCRNLGVELPSSHARERNR